MANFHSKSGKSILDLSADDLTSYLDSIGQSSFRAQQISDWVYKKTVIDFQQMKNLPAEFRDQLAKDYPFPQMTVDRLIQDTAGTTKFLFTLPDSRKIEAVLIVKGQRVTICVSSQAGCKFACRFCASGIGGWLRHLACSEMIMQILLAQEKTGSKITHVVFMGTGEPFDNWEQVRAAINVINDPQGMGIAARRITISTCGLLPGIKKLQRFDKQIELAVSLHGHNDQVRSKLMPINQQYPLKELVSACREYVQATHRQVTFEYVLIDGLTLSDEAPKSLAKLLRGLNCKLNLIPYNSVKEFDWRAPSRNAVYRFRDALIEQGVHATIRWSKGHETDGACGQLRRER